MGDLSRLKRLVLNALLIAGLLVVFGYSYRATGIDFPRLVRDAGKARDIVAAFLQPDLVTRDVETLTIEVAFPIPCGSAVGAEPLTTGPRLVTSVPCAPPMEAFTIEGFDMTPDSEIEVRWRLPNGTPWTVGRAQTDSSGHFLIDAEARPVIASVGGVPSLIQADTLTPVGPYKPSQALNDVMGNMLVTIFMALLATTIATVVAAPLSFLAAANITRRGFIGTAVYYITRSIFNILRSYEPLVMAVVFAFWLGFGPFAGTLAMTVVTIASIGKLFSEAVESIDPGPIEALQATGANRWQAVIYAVIPQIVPDFISFIVYHWDINVRISTIIGFVGGGGIGYYLSEQINLLAYRHAATAIWAIVIVVMALDFLSAEVRKRTI
jgi:phosphonate transport system permease protein